MKKGLIIILALVMVGCTFGNTPTSKVESYLDKYINNDVVIRDELEAYIQKENYTLEQKSRYINVVEKLYKDMQYEIIKETIDDGIAFVEVEIKVKDMYLVNKNAQNYLIDNIDDFYDSVSGYNDSKYIDYLLTSLENNSTTVTHKIIFHLTKKDGMWQLGNMSDDDMMKIHGTYPYDQ